MEEEEEWSRRHGSVVVDVTKKKDGWIAHMFSKKG